MVTLNRRAVGSYFPKRVSRNILTSFRPFFLTLLRSHEKMTDVQQQPDPISPETEDEPEYEEDDGEDEDEDEEFDDESPLQHLSREAQLRAEGSKLESLFRRLKRERVPLRVHDVKLKGNRKTKDSVIEAELEGLRKAKTMQDIVKAAGVLTARLHNMEIFEAVNITLDAGPLPGTANIIVEVVEADNPVSGNIGIYTKPEAKSWSLEGSLKFRNLFGYGDLFDASLAYGWDQTSEVSAGVCLPRISWLKNPVQARLSLLSQDWLKLSSFKERSLGLSLGLISTMNHNLAYNLGWRALTDPSQMSSRSIRRQLGHNLISALKYTYKTDKRNSPLRPTKGYAFVSTSQVGGLAPDSRCLKFLRQEFDFHYSLPLGFYRAALNFGVSAGITFPWGAGFLNMPSSMSERFFLGGNSSPVCTLGSPNILLGFKQRGLGPSEPRRKSTDASSEDTSEYSERDALGGDFATTAFADLSFDLPLKLFRNAGIHGHVFACAGNLTKLTENEYQHFSFKKYFDSFRSTVGFGVVVPTRLFRMEINYCYILKKIEYDHGKTGVQFCFSPAV